MTLKETAEIVKNLKIFVSYSWDTVEHKAWVRKLAEDLDAIHELSVTWDGFDLDETSDTNHFMESGLHEADYIFVVGTRRYAQKANQRKGGVGIETRMASSLNWEQLDKESKSRILILQREADGVPRYLYGRPYVDFSDPNGYQTGLNRLLEILRGEARVARPAKRLHLHSDSRTYTFTRVEDVLRITHKNRHPIVAGADGTDFSAGNKIKFELWETRSPDIAYFLALFANTTLAQTVARVVEVLKRKELKIFQLTVLRPTSGEPGLIKRYFAESGYAVVLNEYTYADYIWTYCIDDELKRSALPETVPNYTDQSARLVSTNEAGKIPGPPHEYDSARALFETALSSLPTPTAHVLVAPGGMGKTSLCRAVALDLLSRRTHHGSVVLVQAESLRDYFASEGLSNVHIRSVYDLYEFYSKSQKQTNIYDSITFDLAVLCGNIAVIIDGLDEIISLLQERFELDRFLQSIQTLHDELGTSNVLITTRTGPLLDEDKLEGFGMVRYQLLGFDGIDCDRYAKRRFSKSSSSEKLTRQFKKKLEMVDLKDASGRVIPFFVDILATVLEEDARDSKTDEFEVVPSPTPYHSNNDLVDHIVFSVLKREELRHNLQIPISDVALLLSEMVGEFGDHIPMQSLHERLRLLYDERADDLLAKLALNPLFIPRERALALRYGCLADYFPVLFLIDSFVRASGDREFLKALSGLNTLESSTFKDLVRFFSRNGRDFKATAKAILAKLLPHATSSDESSTRIVSREEARRGVSAVLRLSARISNAFGRPLMQQILELYDCQEDNSQRHTLSGVYIYGDFPQMDFSNLTVSNSRFSGYTSFAQCKFANTRFMYTVFERCGGERKANRSLSTVAFDRSCDLGDLVQTLQQISTSRNTDEALIEAEVKKFFRAFLHGGRLVDIGQSQMKFSARLAKLSEGDVDRLVVRGYLQVKDKSLDERRYVIGPSLKDSVHRLLASNYVGRIMQEFIEFVR